MANRTVQYYTEIHLHPHDVVVCNVSHTSNSLTINTTSSVGKLWSDTSRVCHVWYWTADKPTVRSAGQEVLFIKASGWFYFLSKHSMDFSVWSGKHWDEVEVAQVKSNVKFKFKHIFFPLKCGCGQISLRSSTCETHFVVAPCRNILPFLSATSMSFFVPSCNPYLCRAFCMRQCHPTPSIAQCPEEVHIPHHPLRIK